MNKKIMKCVTKLESEGYKILGLVVRDSNGKMCLVWGTGNQETCEVFDEELRINLNGGMETVRVVHNDNLQ